MLQECKESILVPEWNFPVYVKTSKDSEALQEFVKIPFGSLLKQDAEKSLDEIRGTSILGEVRNVEISGATQQLLCSKSHDFLAIFALAHSKINQIA